jgi:hypothetical protein
MFIPNLTSFVMKKLLLLLIMLGFVFSSNAQSCDSSLPIIEDFEDTNEVVVCWDFIDADNDGRNWAVVDLGGNNAIESASYVNGVEPFTPDNWIISQAINLTNVGSASVSWNVRVTAWNADNEYYTVYLSTGNQISNFLSNSVSYSEDLNGSYGQWQNRSLNANSLAGETVYVAIRHHNAFDQSGIDFDDVSILGSALGIEDIDQNNFKHYYNPESNVLTLKSSTKIMNSIDLYNILGQNVLDKTLSQTEEKIDLSTLNKGIYIGQVSFDNVIKTIKFVKQ